MPPDSLLSNTVCFSTGRICGSDESGALECELQLQARGVGGGSDWDPIWRCATLFTDDSARFASLQTLNARHQQLLARQQELEDILDAKNRVPSLSPPHPPLGRHIPRVKGSLLGECMIKLYGQLRFREW